MKERRTAQGLACRLVGGWRSANQVRFRFEAGGQGDNFGLRIEKRHGA